MTLNQILVYVGYGVGAIFIIACLVMMLGVLSGRGKSKEDKKTEKLKVKEEKVDKKAAQSAFGSTTSGNFFGNAPVAPQQGYAAQPQRPQVPVSAPQVPARPQAMPVQPVAAQPRPAPVFAPQPQVPAASQFIPQTPQQQPVAPQQSQPQVAPSPEVSPNFGKPNFSNQQGFTLAPEVPNSENNNKPKDTRFNLPF